MIPRLVIPLLALGMPLMAQDNVITSPIDGSSVALPDVAADSVRALTARGAALKGLDKMSGQVADIPISAGQTVSFGRIEISLG